MKEIRQLQNELEESTSAPSVLPSSDFTPLEWDPKALPQHDDLISDTQPNHTMETPKTTELSHRVLESIQNHKLQVTMRDLFSLSPSLTEFVHSWLTEVVTPPSRTPTTEELIAATEAIDKHMPMISICIGKNIVDDVLLNGGSGVNIITEEERRRLGLPKPSPAPFNLKMANETIAKPIGLLRDVKIHIHGNPLPSIPTEGQTQTGPDSSSHTPLRLVITSESEGEYDDDSEVGNTDKEEAAALDEALLEEDDDDDQSEDDANTTGTATPGHEDPYDIQGLGDIPVATTPASSSHMDISPSPK